MGKMSKGFFWALAGAVAYGIQPSFTKLLLNMGLNSTSILFYRFIFLSVVMGSYLVLSKKIVYPNIKQVRDLIVFGIIGYGGTTFLLAESYHFMPMGQATMIYFTYPAWVVLMMVLIFKEKISVFKLGALGLAFLGILFLIEFDLTLNFIGTILALASGLAFGIYLVSVDKSHFQSLDGTQLIFYLGIINSAFFGVQGGLTQSLERLPMEAIVYVVGTGGLTIIALLFLTKAIRLIGPMDTSIISIFEPVVTLIAGVIVFSESLTLNLVIGSIIMIGSILVIIWENKGLEKIK